MIKAETFTCNPITGPNLINPWPIPHAQILISYFKSKIFKSKFFTWRVNFDLKIILDHTYKYVSYT